MNPVKIGDVLVGDGQPCFIILELGVNFDDLAGARRLVDAGAATGASALKFQSFHAATVAMKGAFLFDGRGKVDQYEECLESEPKQTEEFQREILRYAAATGLPAFSTPSHPRDIDMLERIGVPAFKFGSDDLTNLPLLRYAAKTGKPIIISSGVSTLGQIDDAIRAIRAAGNDQICLFHCVSQYPANPKDMNLRTMQTLKLAFGIPVGLSDHTEGVGVSIAAAALGANLIEKHFTIDRGVPGPDNFFSMEPGPMKTIVDGVREAESALGTPIKDIRPAERDMVKNFHKSIFAVRDIAAGEAVTPAHVEVLRPFIGMPAKDLDTVVGLRAARAIKKGSALQWDDFKVAAPVGAAR